jgi:hypothetical protein
MYLQHMDSNNIASIPQRKKKINLDNFMTKPPPRDPNINVLEEIEKMKETIFNGKNKVEKSEKTEYKQQYLRNHTAYQKVKTSSSSSESKMRAKHQTNGEFDTKQINFAKNAKNNNDIDSDDNKMSTDSQIEKETESKSNNTSKTKTKLRSTKYKNKLMMPEFLAEIPSDFETNWFCVPYPAGTTSLSFSSLLIKLNNQMEFVSLSLFGSNYSNYSNQTTPRCKNVVFSNSGTLSLFEDNIFATWCNQHNSVLICVCVWISMVICISVYEGKRCLLIASKGRTLLIRYDGTEIVRFPSR